MLDEARKNYADAVSAYQDALANITPQSIHDLTVARELAALAWAKYMHVSKQVKGGAQ
jgi:hypothetical protein